MLYYEKFICLAYFLIFYNFIPYFLIKFYWSDIYTLLNYKNISRININNEKSIK